MADEATFGPWLDGTDVERAALETLQLWTPEYLAWAERATGRTARSLPEPRSWVTSSDIERWPEETPPTVLVLSTGLAEPPARDGQGLYRATFDLGVAVVVSARTRRETEALAKVYTAALRNALLQHATLGGFAAGIEWVDEEYGVLSGQNRRQLAGGQATFRVDVRDAVASRSGPIAPRPDPYEPAPDDPTATSVEVEVDPEELTP
jgi:hypothetical protein